MAVAENGIFEVSRNKYSKCYCFQDINSSTATEDESKYCRTLFIKKYPSSLSDRFINEITLLPVHSMSDFYDILMEQPEEAKDIALSLELFVNGSLNIFNHQTNVDVDNRFTVYGIRNLGKELSPITMLVMMESVQNRIVEKKKQEMQNNV